MNKYLHDANLDQKIPLHGFKKKKKKIKLKTTTVIASLWCRTGIRCQL